MHDTNDRFYCNSVSRQLSWYRALFNIRCFSSSTIDAYYCDHYIIAAQLLCQTYINENKWSMCDVESIMDALHSTAKYHATQLAGIVHVRRHANIERWKLCLNFNTNNIDGQ